MTNHFNGRAKHSSSMQPETYTLPLLPGNTYHLYNRGNNRQTVFYCHEDYLMFLDKWRKFIPRIASTLTFILIPNHFHAIIQIHDDANDPWSEGRLKTPKSVTNAFRNLFISYARSFQNRYDHQGAVFHSPFKRKLVRGEDDFFQLVAYLHFNTAKHGMSDCRYDTYPYSGYQMLLSEQKTFLDRDRMMSLFGGRENFVRFHRAIGAERWGM